MFLLCKNQCEPPARRQAAKQIAARASQTRSACGKGGWGGGGGGGGGGEGEGGGCGVLILLGTLSHF